MSKTLPVEQMTTHNLWILNWFQKNHEEDTSSTGAELMRRTPTDPVSCEESNQRCAERRERGEIGELI